MNKYMDKNYRKNNYTPSYFSINGIFCIMNPSAPVFFDFTDNNILSRADNIIMFITNTDDETCRNAAWIIEYCKNAKNKTIKVICPDNAFPEQLDTMKIDRMSYEFYSDIPQEYRDTMTMVSFKTSGDVFRRKYGYIVNTEEKSFYFGDKHEKIPEEVMALFDSGVLNDVYSGTKSINRDLYAGNNEVYGYSSSRDIPRL